MVSQKGNFKVFCLMNYERSEKPVSSLRLIINQGSVSLLFKKDITLGEHYLIKYL